MSNYPPGVTGNEYAIAGPRSSRADEEFVGACEKFDLYNIVKADRYPRFPLPITGPVRRARAVLCTFEGECVVEGEVEDHIWFDWICPVCGHSNTTELEAPEPPERDRDDWY